MTDLRPAPTGDGWLDRVERVGNRLPDPATLFALGTLLLMLVSALAAISDWQVERLSGGRAEQVRAVSLLDSDGLWWLLSHLIENSRPIGGS